MSTAVRRLLELYRGREGVYAELNGHWSPVESELTEAALAAHVGGARVLGVYLVRKDNTVYFGSGEFDNEADPASTLPLARRLRANLVELGVPVEATLLSFSGHKGHHLDVFVSSPIAAGTMRRAIDIASVLAGLDVHEIFPKQDSVEPDQVGNLLKLPLCVHPKTKQKAEVLDSHIVKPCDPTILHHLVREHAHVRRRVTVDKKTEPPKKTYGEGERHDRIVELAGRLNSEGVSLEAAELACLDENRTAFDPVAAEDYILEAVRDVYQRYALQHRQGPDKRSGTVGSRGSTAIAEAGPLPEGVTMAGRARLYDLSAYRPDLEATETDWMIKNWIIRGQIHLFVGEEKRGKSTQQWRRIAALSRGDSYLGEPARKALVLAITEMGPEVLATLLDDDDIEPDWSQIRVAFVDEIAREDRLGVIGDAVKEWQPTYLTLDPIDECFGLDENGVFNPAKTADAFEIARLWANQGITIDGLYHYNNQGKIANSYKFRAKPDHIYRIRGTEPADVTYEYQGRVRAIPRKRRLAGNGDEGYEVTLVTGGQVGRPAKTRHLIHQALEGCTVPLSVVELSKRTGVPYPATKQAVLRGTKKGEFEHVEGHGYRLSEQVRNSPDIPSPVPYLSPDSSSKDRYETPLSLKEGSFVPVLSACAHANVSTRDGRLFTCADCGLNYDALKEVPIG